MVAEEHVQLATTTLHTVVLQAVRLQRLLQVQNVVRLAVMATGKTISSQLIAIPIIHRLAHVHHRHVKIVCAIAEVPQLVIDQTILAAQHVATTIHEIETSMIAVAEIIANVATLIATETLAEPAMQASLPQIDATAHHLPDTTTVRHAATMVQEAAAHMPTATTTLEADHQVALAVVATTEALAVLHVAAVRTSMAMTVLVAAVVVHRRRVLVDWVEGSTRGVMRTGLGRGSILAAVVEEGVESRVRVSGRGGEGREVRACGWEF